MHQAFLKHTTIQLEDSINTSPNHYYYYSFLYKQISKSGTKSLVSFTKMTYKLHQRHTITQNKSNGFNLVTFVRQVQA